MPVKESRTLVSLNGFLYFAFLMRDSVERSKITQRRARLLGISSAPSTTLALTEVDDVRKSFHSREERVHGTVAGVRGRSKAYYATGSGFQPGKHGQVGRGARSVSRARVPLLATPRRRSTCHDVRALILAFTHNLLYTEKA